MKTKFLSNLILSALVACILALLMLPAMAQFDTFGGTRTMILAAPQNLTAASNIVTNGPLDTVRFIGTGSLDLLTITNTGTTGGTLTATLYGSPDQTNLTAITGFALISSPTTQSITNGLYGGTNLYCNNSVLVPGTETTPSAASAGYSTPYLAPALFTNSGAITLNGNKTVKVGLRLSSLPRYLYVVYTTGGSVTNFTTSATLTGPVY